MVAHDLFLKKITKTKGSPFVTLLIDGKPLSFLVDTGAELSVIMHDPMLKFPMSNETVCTVGASGLEMTEALTMPLSVEGTRCQHQFVFSSCCPCNLAGGDLMCKLGMKVACGLDGNKITQPQENYQIMMLSDIHTGPDWHYAWNLKSDVNSKRIDEIFSIVRSHWENKGRVTLYVEMFPIC
ncbi:hypothetical protein DPEC_G00206030 [Dallia pectoralis]|uniref:Uncharacterized protein n=1 Tax=Dallia pectoralis TaxID=75939 RepID=A0ACC2G4P1_DALPE|nr:hypothetical protein DPEC_G00206030 [Dallia pectoralis]